METVKERLLEERAATLKLMASLTGDWDGVVEASTQIGLDDEHDPEGATIAFERARVEASLSEVRERLTEIEDALHRVRDGTYGTCEHCGGPIGEGRLEARPTARTCITCARA
ncbi:MAG TPA: TraR/DksA C4-type zinc finger protein [Spirillospora sp.]